MNEPNVKGKFFWHINSFSYVFLIDMERGIKLQFVKK